MTSGEMTSGAMTSGEMNEASAAFGRAKIVPVVTLDDAHLAPPLTVALADGGMSTVEITLRTSAGLDAIRLATEHRPDLVIGAGSVMSPAAATDAIDAGAQFLVSPGLDADTIGVAHDRGIAIIPGVATATEIMRAVDLGVEIVKVFPAEQIGGPGLIRAFAAVWPDLRFMPTGGIGPTTAAAYLAIPEVMAVGGSWMIPSDSVRDGDWAAVSTAAADAVSTWARPR